MTDTYVTAAAEAVDNATLTPTEQTANPPVVEPGSTGEDVDDSGTKTHEQRMQDYRERRQALLSKPAGEAAPAPNPPPAAPAVTPPAPAATTDEEEFPSAPTDGRMPQIKLRAVTPVDVQAMAEFKASQKAGNKQSLVEFIQTRFPSAPAAAATVVDDTTSSTATATNQEPTTVAELDALLAEKKAARRAARQEFDFDTEAKIEDEEETLRAKRDVLLQSEAEGQTAAQKAWETQETEYLTKVGTMFPQAKNAEDPLVVRANEILNEWFQGKDARASHPSRAMYCYVEAAAELGITPSGAAKSAPLKQTSTPSPVHRAPITAIIAGGNATQTQTREQVDTRTYEQKKAEFLAKKQAA